MRSLGFAAPVYSRERGNKRVRQACFEARSMLPVSAACVVANGVRETLSSLLGGPIAMRLVEPTIPSPEAWAFILQRARLYRVRGNVADAALILRPPDATALAATLFGESNSSVGERVLSPIESDVLDRMVASIAPNLAAVCGAREGASPEVIGSLSGFVTYFELLVEQPAGARIGIALSRDPSPECGASLEAAHLAGVNVTALACLDAGNVEVAALARLTVGTIVPLPPVELQRCILAVHGRRFAIGNCGVRNDRYALRVDAIHEAI